MLSIETAVIAWLLGGDPAIRYQVHRDLLHSDAKTVATGQARIAEAGWGARFLALQQGDGQWGGGLYSPKFISTHYTLLALRRIGLAPGHPQALKACQLLLDEGFVEADGGINFVKSRAHAETCITGMMLSMLAWFRLKDERVHRVADHLVVHQMEDGGWNCRAWRGDAHASFHTTCSALEGLLEYQKAYLDSELPLSRVQAAGREFFLNHHLYKSHRTGEIVKEPMLRFPFPPQWHYDFLKGLDYFQAAGAPGDERAADAIELLLSRRDTEGRWPQYRGPSGKYHFQMETPGNPGRWNTLRALRVLNWWHGD